MIADFYQKLFWEKKIESINEYFDNVYTQSNTVLPDVEVVLKKGLTKWFKGTPK